MAEILSVVDEKLPMQLDSVSWNKKFNLLAIGAYMIEPTDSTKRVGKVYLVQLNHNHEQEEDKPFDIIQEIDLPGVLDLRWESDSDNQVYLAVATSSTFEIYELGHENFRIVCVDKIELGCMALYTQWISNDKIVFSDSEGFINIVKTHPLKLETAKKIHDNLTWVVQYSAQHNLIFAGSDEGKFTGFLLDNIEDDEKHYFKKFQVGVTSIIFMANNILAVGSYDDTLRLFTIDCSNPISLTLKKKIEFGGAVWRTMSFQLPKIRQLDMDIAIVAACARNGIHIVYLNTETWNYKTVAKCLEHEGFLAYGLDVSVKINCDNLTFLVASCYFDNQHLHLWKTTI